MTLGAFTLAERALIRARGGVTAASGPAGLGLYDCVTPPRLVSREL